ncbi:MAG: signal peptidase I [Candidatus Pacearchaeota archaeon]
MGFFNWLWKSNSILSWVLFLVIIFVIVKFIIFPVSGFVLGTKMPFVIVESGSMHHEGNLSEWFALHGSWYQANNISYNEIKEYWPFINGLNKGDIVVVKGSKEYKKGQVIVFRVEGKKIPIIHRIIAVEKSQETIYSTKGDHNDGQLPQELAIKKEQIIGKAIVRIPALGWIKLFFVEIFK